SPWGGRSKIALPTTRAPRQLSRGALPRLRFVSAHSSWRGTRAPVASDFVTTVDQSDIRGLATGMSLIRQGLPPLYELASGTSCEWLEGGMGVPPEPSSNHAGPLGRPPPPLSALSNRSPPYCRGASSPSPRPTPQMNPATSRAPAVTASAGCLP